MAAQAVELPLFLLLLAVIGGSYALMQELRSARPWGALLRLGSLALLVGLLEALFMYRPLVDGLVRWLVLHESKNIELGAISSLSLAALLCVAVRGLTWYLFAQAGTPALLRLIQGIGLTPGAPVAWEEPVRPAASYGLAFYQRLVMDARQIRSHADGLLAAFVMPPLPLLAAAINFLTLLTHAQALFRLPLRNLPEAMEMSAHWVLHRHDLAAQSQQSHPDEPLQQEMPLRLQL